MNNLLIIIIVLFFSSCSFLRTTNKEMVGPSKILDNSKKRFTLTDKSGEFIVYRENGLKSKLFITKRQVLPFNDDSSKILEQSIVFSKIGRLGKKLKIMRPLKSEYTVWFDGKKYVSRMDLNEKKQSLIVKLTSPEDQWKGTHAFRFPDTKSVYCFFSQVLECSAITGFIKEATNKGKGTMNFYIIWDGYPYFHEQYLDIPKGVFTKAKLNYDGKNKSGETRLSLSFGQQVIFYLFDKKKEFSKKYWVSQGLSMSLTNK